MKISDTTVKKITSLCVVLLMSTMLIKNVSAQEVYVPESDSLALVAFYHAMSGDDWINNGGWLVDRVDTWHGVTTTNVGTDEEPEWRVHNINLQRNMTQPGYIPPEIGDLEHLRDLILRQDPSLYGVWPEEIGKLIRIRDVETQNSNMSGEIPWSELAKTPIRRIRFQSAKHYGEMPDIFGEMTQLQRIQIDNQFLSGPIPPSVALLDNLDHFRLNGNLLTGDLPDMRDTPVSRIYIAGNPMDPGPIWPWLEDMGEQIENLYIANSNRTGTIPEWFATTMFELSDFTIGETSWDLENALGGEFPDMSAMVALDGGQVEIHGPHWTGGLPDWIGGAGRTPTTLNFYFCSFSGPIPDTYIDIDRFRLHHCPEVTGGIPAVYENWSGRTFEIRMADDWTNLYERFGAEAADYFSNPQMQVGNIPEYIGNWASRNIDLKGVGLTGTIPASLLNNEGLETLDLSNNPELTGTLPEGLRDRPISSLNVSHTGLGIPEFPAWLIDRSQTIRGIGMAGVGMGGTIPEWISDLSLISSLDLSNNNLTGPVPPAIGDLPLMTALNLSNNQLSGELPGNFAEMGYLDGFYALQNLDLSGNPELTGGLPPRFAQADRMRILRYNDTQIWAPEDEDFLNWQNNVIPGNDVALSYPPLYVDVQTSGLIGPPVTSIDEPVASAYRFHLGNNYPNPFNPSTSFAYEIPVEGHVTLSIYNVLGQHVVTLVDEVRAAGSHQVTFDAGTLSSGTYLYRLKSGSQVTTRSMMLIK